MSEQLRVAICQPYVIMGGRLQVMLGIIRVLNEMGIVPDLLTANLSFDLNDITSRYEQTVKINLRLVQMPKLPQDLGVLVFHNLLSRYTGDYDLLINTSNSLNFLPKNANVLTYMFYPRKSRIMGLSPDIHQPDERLPFWSKAGLMKVFLRQVYRLSRPNPAHHIICMTQFTCRALHDSYPSLSDNLPLVYPAVDTSRFETHVPTPRQRAIVSVGRFEASKRQLEQIKLAEAMPDIPFHLVGFANNSRYYQQCADYVQAHNLTHVHLHADAPFTDMIALLQSARYFLHTMINEPFGLTAVQAIAAGCLPIVHDSGGQRETVPFPELRYQSLDEIPALLKRLDAMPDSEVKARVAQLQNHARQHFDESVFHQQMHDILIPILDDVATKALV